MADVLTPEQRRLCMSRIRGTNTNPELLVRRLLFSRGWRYRLHSPKLPGRPDLVLPKVQAVIFVHGCFWHGHQCPLFRWPATNQKFWEQKINSNVAKDQSNQDLLIEKGWRQLTIWECALRGRGRLDPEAFTIRTEEWLMSQKILGEVFGVYNETGRV